MVGAARWKPGWVNKARVPKKTGGSGSPPAGFRRKAIISLPGVLNFQPHYLNKQLLVGVKGFHDLVLSYTREGRQRWGIERKHRHENVRTILEIRGGILIYSLYNNQYDAFVRHVNWKGRPVNARRIDPLKNLRFHFDPTDGGVFVINEYGRIGKWREGELENAYTIFKQDIRIPNIFLTNGKNIFFQGQKHNEDLLYAYDKSENRLWKEPFGSGKGLRFVDAFLGDSYYPKSSDYKGKVFISTDDARVYAVDILTGKVAWQVEPLNHVSGPIWLQPNKCLPPSEIESNIFATNPDEGAISAIRLYSMRERKVPFPVGFEGRGGFSRPTALKDTIWMAATSRDGYVHIFKDGVGEEIARIKTNVIRPFAPVDLGNHQFAVPTSKEETDSPSKLSIYAFDY